MTTLNPNTDSLVDAEAVAAVLSISTLLVRRLARQGKLPAVRVGDRLLRFNVADVLRSLPPRSGAGVDVRA